MQPTTKKPFNPFYFFLLIVGTLFAITACAYGVMALRLGRIEPVPATSANGTRLIQFLAEHGTSLLVGELIALAILTVAAIGTDEFWTRRANRQNAAAPTPLPTSSATTSKDNV